MEFRILGPVEVWHDVDRLPISAPRQLAVLTSLLTRPDSVVPIDTIIEDLWGATPPRSATVTVRNYVQRLRRALPEPVLESAPSGYRLHIRRDQLDLHRFRALAAQARETTDPAEADTLFDHALNLWRGTPLLGIGDPPLRALQVAKLEELYLGILEDSFDVALRLRRHVALVAQLTELAATYPLRERIRGQLMLALYRSGRPAEALGHYRRIRTDLVNELGMEPGSELRHLEQAILREDESLVSPTDSATPDRPGRAHVPDTLPTTTATFVGRTAELAQLRARFAATSPTTPVLCLLHGPGGSGKSTLAIRLAHELIDRFPDGVLYADLRGSTPGAAPRSTTEILQSLIRALGGADTDLRQDIATTVRTYRTRLRGRRVLLVLDNAASTSQVLPAIPDEPGCSVLVTSRSVITAPGEALSVHVGAFERDEAVELLRRIVGDHKIEAEPAAAEELTALCGRLPLALRLIATRAVLRPHWPLQSWVGLLADEHRRLDQLRHQDADVRASFLVSLQGLRTGKDPAGYDADKLFRRLGLLDGSGCTAALAAALTGWPVPRAEAALEHLVDVGMLFSPEPSRYALYDLLALLAREQAAAMTIDEQQRTLRDAIDWYRTGVRHCAELVLGSEAVQAITDVEPTDTWETVRFDDYESARTWLDREINILVELLRQGVRGQVVGIAELLGEFTRLLSWYFSSSMRWIERTLLGETILTLAQADSDRLLEGVGLGQLSIVEAQRGNLADADRMSQRAVELFADSGPSHDRIAALNNRAGVAVLRGRYDEALALCERAREEASSGGYHHLFTTSLSNIATVYAKTDRLDEAARLLETTAEINARIGYIGGRIVNLNTLVDVHSELGSHHAAIRYGADVLQLHEKLGSDYMAAECLIRMAGSLHKLGRVTEARARYHAARDRLATISTREQIRLAVLLEQFAPAPELS